MGYRGVCIWNMGFRVCRPQPSGFRRFGRLSGFKGFGRCM